MKSSTSPLLILPFLLLLISCDKDPEQIGCTDPIALNYEPRALKDDGQCTYNQAEQVIWQEGAFGGWNSDFHEGAYRLDVCAGTAIETAVPLTDTTQKEILYLGTGGSESHLSVFSVINERSAKDFAEGSLRFDVRLSHETNSAPEFFRVFISGKIPDGQQCEPYLRSGYVELSSRQFNDTAFTEVSIPIRHFSHIMMSRINVVAGFEFEGTRNQGVEIDRLRWVANAVD